MSRTTRATVALDRAGAPYTVHTYDYDPGADRIGLQAAEALGAPAARVLKTLMTLVDRKPVCVLLASDREVSMKALAAAAGGKTAEMMRPADAERITGYHVGGICPFGHKRILPVILDAGAMDHARVFVNGGQRGVQVELAPADIVRVLKATTAAIAV